MLQPDTYNSLLLASAEGNAFATNDRLIPFRELGKIFVQVAGLDDFSIKVGVEVGVPDNVLTNSVVLGIKGVSM